MTIFDSCETKLCHSSGVASQAFNALINERGAHKWVTVVNPSNQRLLLQACDDCGVVKSENSVVKVCRAKKGKALISNALQADIRLVG